MIKYWHGTGKERSSSSKNLSRANPEGPNASVFPDINFIPIIFILYERATVTRHRGKEREKLREYSGHRYYRRIVHEGRHRPSQGRLILSSVDRENQSEGR